MLIVPSGLPGEICPPPLTATLARLPVPPRMPPLWTVTGLTSEPLTRSSPWLIDVGPL